MLLIATAQSLWENFFFFALKSVAAAYNVWLKFSKNNAFDNERKGGC